MAFNGTLLLLGGTNFPLGYIYKESYKVAPNRALDLDSTRTANGVMTRTVLDHTATTISFDVRPMWNDDCKRMWDFIRSKFINDKEKKVRATYYSPELDDYKSGDFYIPDFEFPINLVDVKNKRILYNSYTLEFIEY